MVKKLVDKDGLDERSKEEYSKTPLESRAHIMGIAGDPILEPVPHFITLNTEKVIRGSNNSWIVLGRDRPASRVSGYGGIGDTQCAAIDLIVGRMASSPQNNVYVDPDFTVDAARIYISQKTDIDINFNLVDGQVGNAKAKSGIGIKADGIRLVAREGIKLVTGTDRKNSQGGMVDANLGIDIIAGNDDSSLQPMVKGNNLSEALDALTKNIEQLSGILSAFLQSQMKYNAVLSTHTHISPFFGIITAPSEAAISTGTQTTLNQMNDCILGLQKFKANVIMFKNNYLRSHGEKYINSRLNNVN